MTDVRTYRSVRAGGRRVSGLHQTFILVFHFLYLSLDHLVLLLHPLERPAAYGLAE